MCSQATINRGATTPGNTSQADTRLSRRRRVQAQRDLARSRYLDVQRQRDADQSHWSPWQPVYRLHERLRPHYVPLLILGCLAIISLPAWPVIAVLVFLKPVRHWLWQQLQKTPNLLATVMMIKAVLVLAVDRLPGARKVNKRLDGQGGTIWRWQDIPAAAPCPADRAAPYSVYTRLLSPHGRYHIELLLGQTSMDHALASAPPLRSLSVSETCILKLAVMPERVQGAR